MHQHVFSSETPVGCFMNVGRNLMMSSPEFCFLQMANHLSLVELLELGYELCGEYSLPLPHDKKVPKRGFYNRKQLTSTKKLQEFLNSMPGVKGSTKAIRALTYLQDGSASPMETKLALFMVLPYKLGGFGFEKPELNRRVNLTKSVRKYFRKEYYVCDLFWAEKKVAVEYDSDQNHTGSERIASDSKKRNALVSMGIQVVSVTKQQLYNSKELESAVRTVAKHMGKRLFPAKSNFPAAHLELRKELLKHGG
ncbi:MAG: endonuclease domain-containing protein [Coriobacteriia bacterium]|nr:endonuclease domain-containing protein [Coriobacteriia bacterium]